MLKRRKRDTLLLVEKRMINVGVKVDIEEDREAMMKKLNLVKLMINPKIGMLTY